MWQIKRHPKDPSQFDNYLYAQGKDGGAEAASLLHAGLKTQLSQLYPEAHVSDWNIVVNVVLNAQGLGTKLQACGIIDNPNELSAFGRAFGLAHPLFNFIDVGNGKERADHKIRETLRLFLPMPQCKHIFFGPCHDNGYLPVLEPFKRDQSTSTRISLVETTPAEPGFAALGFKRVKFPDVFRDTNLPNRPSIAPVTSPAPRSLPVRTASSVQASTSAFPPIGTIATKDSSKPKSPSPVQASTDSNSWATVGKSSGPKNIDIAPKKVAPRRHVVLNADDERLDAPLPRPDLGAEKRFLARTKEQGKCCNNYHLTGHCPTGEYCDYIHGERLSPGEILVMKHKARSITCAARQSCRDVDCTFGHHCKFGGKGCYSDSCWFSDTHYMDLVSSPHHRYVCAIQHTNLCTGARQARLRKWRGGVAHGLSGESPQVIAVKLYETLSRTCLLAFSLSVGLMDGFSGFQAPWFSRMGRRQQLLDGLIKLAQVIW